MKKLIIFLVAVALLASCSTRHTKEGYLPVTTTSDSAAKLFYSAVDTFHFQGVPKAMNMWNQAIELDSNFFTAYVYRAMTFRQFNQMENFNKEANRALSCELEYNQAESVWKEILDVLVEDPEQDFSSISKQFVEHYPDVAESYLNMSYGFQDQPDEIIEALSKAVEIQPDDPWFRCMFGYQLFQNERFEEALEQFKVYRNLLPDAPNVYDSYADLYIAMENYGAAYECAMKAHQLGWPKTKADQIKETMMKKRFVSLHLFNLSNESDETDFIAIIDEFNQVCKDLGYGNIQYKISKLKDGYDSEKQYIMQSTWPSQEVYDKVHNSEKYLAVREENQDVFNRVIRDHVDAKYRPLN